MVQHALKPLCQTAVQVSISEVGEALYDSALYDSALYD